ncbi:nagb/rpia/CoA transferase-like protein [Hypoxylon sp. FL1150]|nr:nagb/rpia/CoA transferase-like protein [Hypoxylon sp. FL1150]
MQGKERGENREVGEKEQKITYRSVAGSFLFKFPNGDEKQAQVALFRRSADVRTYPHKLAPVSGSVEEKDASPMETALREIKEETGLTSDSLQLLRVGKPYSFLDESLSREWTINPFAFRLLEEHEGGKGEKGITLDWEHEGFQWFNPLDVNESEDFGGVPKLVNSLRRVWPEYDLGPKAAKVMTFGIRQLQDDHENGARVLARNALSTFKNIIEEMDSEVIDNEWWAKVRMAAWHICEARKSMGAAITNAIIKALENVEEIFNTDESPSEKIRQMIKAIDEQLEQRNHAIERIREEFVQYVRNVRDKVIKEIENVEEKKELSILTLSASSTVLSALSALWQVSTSLGVPLELRILESRPLFEGVTLASKLLEAGDKSAYVRISIYTDAAVAQAVRGVDILLLGADRINLAGDVSNKIGSLPAVLCAKHMRDDNVDVIVLSETEKIAPGSNEEHKAEENNPKEVREAWDPDKVEGAQTILNAAVQDRVRLRNTYFEWVPTKFIDAYITDQGYWTADSIDEIARWTDREKDRFFEDL